MFSTVWGPSRYFRVSRLPLLLVLFSVPLLPCGPPISRTLSAGEVDRRVDALLAKLTLEQKIALIAGEDGMFTRAAPSIGLPRLKMSDGPMGVRTWGPTTGYAAGIGLAASWDVKLAQEIGAALGRDARARGVNFLLGPGVNIYRAPMNGRNFEYFGEDPYLAGQMAAHYILGVQSQDVVATVKHFAANNSEYDRHGTNSIIDERTLREIYLPAFEAAVQEGQVGAVMDSYNLVNGEHSTQNKFLNVDVLKRDWGFRGIVMSDWGATYDTVAAANAGLDLEMPSAQFMNPKTLLPAIKAGKVSVATIDDKVRRLLRLAIEFGFIEHEQQDLNIPLYSQRSRAVALQSAAESMVLLKNEGNLLPLDTRNLHSIAVIGPDAYPAVPSAGGSAHVTPFAPVSFMTGLSDALASPTKVYWNRGLRELSDVYDSSRFFTDPQGTHPGLRQEKFSNPSFSGTPDRVRVVSVVGYGLGEKARRGPHTGSSVRWKAYYLPKVSGSHSFIAGSSGPDSYWLYVNGKLVLEGKPGQGEPQEATVELQAGKSVSVRLDYVRKALREGVTLGAAPTAQLLDPNVNKVAAAAGVVVLAVGFNPETEGEGRDRTYRLPPGQDELIKTVLGANPHTIVLLTAGGSVDATRWVERVPVFLQSWYGGSEAGRALAEVLTGQVSPSGKLPITWWRRAEDNPSYPNYYEKPGTHDVPYREGVFLGYRAVGRPGQPAPLFPFGFGLSYTHFAFSHLTVSPREVSPKEPITVSFDVQNLGQRAGAEVAEIYVGDPSASVPRPEKELKGFARRMLQPGETKQISITLNQRSLAYWSVKSKNWQVDPGKFVVYVGDSSDNLPLQAEFTVQ